MPNERLSIFTIIATNYVGQAACLAESIRAQHPEAEFTVWLIDDTEFDVQSDLCEYRRVSSILTEIDYVTLNARYSLMEFATAVKPFVAQFTFNAGSEYVIYVDPDIYFYRPMSGIVDSLRKGATGVLLPHMNSPMPKDGLSPSDKDILAAGSFNLGFIALRKCNETAAFLDWWWGWLQTDCFSDPKTGVFTDQKWVNFAPVFFPGFFTETSPVYDVAYWNLHERSLTFDSAGQPLVNDTPLVFFHFSGFNFQTPNVLSKHQTRFHVSSDSALAKLLAGYRDRMIAHVGVDFVPEKVSRLTFLDGEPLDDIAIHLLTQALKKGLKFNTLRGNGEGSFREYLMGTEPGQSCCRYVVEVLDRRPDVANSYERTNSSILKWVQRNGSKEMGLNPGILARRPVKGVHIAYIGYLRATSGVAEAARGYISSLKAAGYEPVLVDVSAYCNNPIDNRGSAAQYVTQVPDDAAIVFLHVNADQTEHIVRSLQSVEKFKKCYVIGLWAWETPEIPPTMHGAFEFVDELWVASSFIAQAVSQFTTVPVVTIPYAINVQDVGSDRDRFGFAADEFAFLFSFDFSSYAERKNPRKVVEAFRVAFSDRDRVRLVIKSVNGQKSPDRLSELIHDCEGLPITLIDEALSDDDRCRLLKSCDCFVSLHRAEGFGLGLAEAMAYGKPVIATGWSGNCEFMTPFNSLLVDYDLEPLLDDIGPYPKKTLWAEPDVSSAAACMRRIYDDPDLRESLGKRAKNDVTQMLSYDSIGSRADKRIQYIMAEWAANGGRRPVRGQQRSMPKPSLLNAILTRPGRIVRKLPAALGVLRNGGLRELRTKVSQYLSRD